MLPRFRRPAPGRYCRGHAAEVSTREKRRLEEGPEGSDAWVPFGPAAGSFDVEATGDPFVLAAESGALPELARAA